MTDTVYPSIEAIEPAGDFLRRYYLISPVQYLESPRYEHLEHPNAIPSPLLTIAGHFWSERDDAFIGMADLPHDDQLCKASKALCTGDGFRWTPDTPELRFR